MGKIAAFGSWDVFPFIVNEKRSSVSVNTRFELAEGANLTERKKILNELQPIVPSPWGLYVLMRSPIIMPLKI